jgi:hypothetical protein
MSRQVLRLVGCARQWFDRLAARFGRAPRLTVVRTEEMPERPSPRHLYVVGERGEDWYAALSCPCRCGAVIDLNLVPPGRPCWKLMVHSDGTPTLTPSVWRQVDCGAHFFVRQGRVVWAPSSAREWRARADRDSTEVVGEQHRLRLQFRFKWLCWERR